MLHDITQLENSVLDQVSEDLSQNEGVEQNSIKAHISYLGTQIYKPSL